MMLLMMLMLMLMLRLLGHAIAFVALILLIVRVLVLMCYHNFFHLINRYGTFYINPLALNDMLLFQFEHKVYTVDIIVSDEAESPWLVSTLILQYHTVFNLTEVAEVFLEAGKGEVVWKAADEKFAQLSIYLVTARQGLLPDVLKGVQFFLILQNLLA